MIHYSLKELKRRLSDIDFFLPIKELSKLPELLNVQKHLITKLRQSSSVAGDGERKFSKFNVQNYLSFTPKYESRFRAFIPISSGCNHFCSYCVVPYSRGREQNRPAEEIISEAKNLIQKGYKEIWLLGQNVNSYRFKLKTKNEKLKTNENIITFIDLLKTINKMSGNFWLRFTSPHPKDFSDDLIRAMAECQNFPHYLNLPVQSGDNEILKKMNRPYTREHYIKLVQRIRKALPDIALSTDVIVGFPGETKKQFQNTVKLFQEIKFDMAYISEYSERTGTLAAKKFKDDIPKKEKTWRKKELTEVLSQTALENNKKLAGEILAVLIDEKKNNRLFGRTTGNKVVELIKLSDTRNENLIGQFAKIKIIKTEPWKLKGELFN